MIFYSLIDEDSNRKTEHEAAYKLLSYVLEKYYKINSFQLGKGEHGKPYLENVQGINFNISHCRGLVVCGVSENDIGVDVEYFRRFDEKVMERIFSPSEKEYVLSSDAAGENFFRIWTLKEALGKYIGTGLFSDLKKYSFSFDGEAPVCGNSEGKIFTQMILHEKWVVSVCANDPENEFVFINKTCFDFS